MHLHLTVAMAIASLAVSACDDGRGENISEKQTISLPNHVGAHVEQIIADGFQGDSVARLSRTHGTQSPGAPALSWVSLEFERYIDGALRAELERNGDPFAAYRESTCLLRLSGKFSPVHVDDFAEYDDRSRYAPVQSGSSIPIYDDAGLYQTLEAEPFWHDSWLPLGPFGDPDGYRYVAESAPQRAPVGDLTVPVVGGNFPSIGNVTIPFAEPFFVNEAEKTDDRGYVDIDTEMTWQPSDTTADFISVGYYAFHGSTATSIFCQTPDDGRFSLPDSVSERLPEDVESASITIARSRLDATVVNETLVYVSTSFQADWLIHP